MFASVSHLPLHSKGLWISKIWEIDHENAYLQFRSLGLCVTGFSRGASLCPICADPLLHCEQ